MNCWTSAGPQNEQFIKQYKAKENLFWPEWGNEIFWYQLIILINVFDTCPYERRRLTHARYAFTKFHTWIHLRVWPVRTSIAVNKREQQRTKSCTPCWNHWHQSQSAFADWLRSPCCNMEFLRVHTYQIAESPMPFLLDVNERVDGHVMLEMQI